LDELKEIFENEVEGMKDDVKQRILSLIDSSKASLKSAHNHVKAEVMS